MVGPEKNLETEKSELRQALNLLRRSYWSLAVEGVSPELKKDINVFLASHGIIIKNTN